MCSTFLSLTSLRLKHTIRYSKLSSSGQRFDQGHKYISRDLFYGTLCAPFLDDNKRDYHDDDKDQNSDDVGDRNGRVTIHSQQDAKTFNATDLGIYSTQNNTDHSANVCPFLKPQHMNTICICNNISDRYETISCRGNFFAIGQVFVL